MLAKFRDQGSISLFGAIAVASVFSSLMVFLVGMFGAKPFLSEYVRTVVRGHQATIESFFKESISQQILIGDGPEVLRKCHMLLREDFVRAVSIKDLNGEIVCNLQKPKDEYALRWSKSPIFFDENGEHLATDVWLAFSTQAEQRLIWAVMVSLFLGIALLLTVQILVTIPLTRRILRPLADLSSAVKLKNPEEIALPDLQDYRPVVKEVRSIFQSMHSFLEKFLVYKTQLIESTRFEAVARTVQIIAHDLKAPMASFERLTRIPDTDFPKEKRYLVQALQQLYSMTDAIKRAEFEDIVRTNRNTLNFDPILKNCQSIAEQLGKILIFEGALEIQEIDIDETKLHRSIGNLIINALEAAKSKVVVSHSETEDQLTICVQDDGPGIPMGFESRLFLRGATQGKDQGTGLGLHFVQRVAQGHGGDVRYRRTDGLTQFLITIPKIPQKTVRPAGDEESAEQDAVSTTIPKAMLVIVVDKSRLEYLHQKLGHREDIDICLPGEHQQFSGTAYSVILSEDWQLARHLIAIQQKVLIDPVDSVEKLITIVERFAATRKQR